jgi:dienelactone hydrolase
MSGLGQRQWPVIAALMSLILSLAGCGGDLPSASSTSAAAASPEAASTPPLVPIEQFCTGYSIPAGITQRRLEAPDGALLNSAWLGSGETAAVLLHQGDGNGLCGFLFYADFLAKRGIKVALLDFCDYGQSSCLGKPIAEDRSAQVKVITDAARADGARRVALVGASLGGAVAVTAARTTKPDAIVDLSGGAKEEQSDIEADAEYVTMPAMFAFSHSDQADLAAVRAELKSMPTKRKVFLTYDDGHGYTLLSDLTSGEFTSLATRVANWVKSS